MTSTGRGGDRRWLPPWGSWTLRRVPERADLYTPPLTVFGHVWRTSVDLVLWLGVLVGSFVGNEAITVTPVAVITIDILLGVLCLGLSFLRRRWPFPIALAVNVCGAFSASSAAAGLLVGVSLATRRVAWQLVVVGGVGLGATLVLRVVQPASSLGSPWWGDLLLALVVTVAMFGWGLYIGSRRELLWTLRDRAERAEALQELRFSQGRANERARIAREMHDVLAHRITLITMHAGALTYRTDLTGEQVRETAEVIQHASREALTDLRQVLGVLRGDAAGAAEFAERPQPTLADLEGLVGEVRATGTRVDLVLDVVLDAVGDALGDLVGRTVYRVIQEGLTNAGKHAPGTAVSVRVSGSPPDGVLVRIENPAGGFATGSAAAPAPPSSGLGLIGLRERVELVGGRLWAGPDGDRFVLEVWLPWTT